MSSDDPLREDIRRWQATLAEGSFEDLVTALEETVHTLEEGRLPLDTTVMIYEIGTKIAQRCEQLLEQAELRVATIDATLSTEVLDELVAESEAAGELEPDAEDNGDEFPF